MTILTPEQRVALFDVTRHYRLHDGPTTTDAQLIKMAASVPASAKLDPKLVAISRATSYLQSRGRSLDDAAAEAMKLPERDLRSFMAQAGSPAGDFERAARPAKTPPPSSPWSQPQGERDDRRQAMWELANLSRVFCRLFATTDGEAESVIVRCRPALAKRLGLGARPAPPPAMEERVRLTERNLDSDGCDKYVDDCQVHRK